MEYAIILLILAVIAGFYMAWNIGANDVANAMGTSVGSKALTIVGAVVVAAVFEFAGAFLAGSHVTSTISKGIIDIDVIASRGLVDELAFGMVAALLAAAVWLNLASRLGWPVSTTHSIVGAVLGFGIVVVGATNIDWSTVGKIALSWVVSPVTGGVLAVLIYRMIVVPVYRSKEPTKALRRIIPPATGFVFFMLTVSMAYKGLKHVVPKDLTLGEVIIIAAVVGMIAYGIAHILIIRRKAFTGNSPVGKVKYAEPVFAILQIITACYMAFAHGANDVANAVGPLAAVVEIAKTGEIGAKVPVPMWVLALGGVGIVIGLATYGYRVMATIGKKITEITPSRGFCAEFGCATTVLICSKLGMPISTTHTLVGAVIGVGLVKGMRGLDLRVVKEVGMSWLVTIPFAAILSIIFYFLLIWIF